MLVEKMVNTKNVLESPHTLPIKSSQPGFVPFDPLQYLIKTQKAAFHAVMHLWNKKPLKVYGGRMSESILAILCHIIKGEVVIKERLAVEREKAEKERAAAGGSASSAGGAGSQPAGADALPGPSSNAAPPRPAEPEFSQEHLQQVHID